LGLTAPGGVVGACDGAAEGAFAAGCAGVKVGIWARTGAMNERLVAQKRRRVATRLMKMIVRRGGVC
jgi:hypothetical protein